jgi:hypothetical protein
VDERKNDNVEIEVDFARGGGEQDPRMKRFLEAAELAFGELREDRDRWKERALRAEKRLGLPPPG